MAARRGSKADAARETFREFAWRLAGAVQENKPPAGASRSPPSHAAAGKAVGGAK